MSRPTTPFPRYLLWLAIFPYLAGGALFLTSSLQPTPPPAPTVMDGMIGEVRLFGGNFAPRGWALCDGQLLPIASNTALFSILGTTYGGDGRTTFALPDLRGRVAVHPGTGPGLTPRRLGERFGAEAVTLTTAQLPAHSHKAGFSREVAKGQPAAGQQPSSERQGLLYQPEVRGVRLGTESVEVSVGQAGNSQPVATMPPAQGLNYIICLQGIFPSRN